MEYNGMNDNEIIEYIEKLETDAKSAEKTISDLTAERDSFKTENDDLKKKNGELESDSKKLKETNYRLARQMDSGKKDTFESVLDKMFR